MELFVLEEDLMYERNILGVYSTKELVEEAMQKYSEDLNTRAGSPILGSNLSYYPITLDEMPQQNL